ncbi:acyltransferase family protein [Pectinatus haikarae]|uniref:Peptidoglycan/LPS O-acetylase OafA/YrhL n=1 Tax=Pectinatus haikarae TaxID=349096 RepID=A0ABT9Y6L8_9FIRM|nr:acyltransferase family protein [Pectinatus haikarae]MDQ0202857.1 peptidoglycan/LPS O-acetylase OafA/YrhL [Pectinatus haikarae]
MKNSYSKKMLYGIEQNSPAQQYIPGLDALRTFAIIGVTLFHIFPDTVKGGYLGVSLFFVLTGYLLAYTSKSEWETGSFNLIDYYIKRIKRIYPSLLIVVFTTVGIYHFLAPDAILAIRSEVLSVILGYNNWWQITQNADYFTRITNASPFTHLWFMGIELQYYLAWPVIFLIYTRTVRLRGKSADGAIFIAVLGIVTAVLMPMMYQSGQDITRLYYGTDTRVYALLFGAAMGLYSKDGKNITMLGGYGLIKFLVFALLLIMVIAAYWLMDGENAFTYQGGMLIITVAFCILLDIIADHSLNIGKYLDISPFRWIGKRSYGIFLWQYPVIFLFNHKEWNQQPFYELIELTAIILLTIWLDAVLMYISRYKLSYIGNRLVIIQCAVFMVITVSGISLMGYGCKEIVVSASNKKIDTQLQAKLAENTAALEEQNNLNNQTDITDVPDVPQVKLDGAICIGDSVMLGSATEIRQALPASYIDAEVSRYVGGALDVAKRLNGQGRLGNIIVIALGTNGPIAGQERYEAQTRELLAYLGSERQIFWVNVYCPDLKWQNVNNEYLAKIAAQHRNITIVDWYSLISKHPEWLVKDGIHPNDEGTVQYAKLLHDSMVQALAAQTVIVHHEKE